MSDTPEGRVKKDVKKLLKQIGAWYYMPVQTGRGVAGAPDFICCIKGRFVGIETKAPGKRLNLSEPQKFQLSAIASANGETHVVDDVEQLMCLLDNKEAEIWAASRPRKTRK